MASPRTLSESEAYFRSLVDASPAMIWVTDPEGYCTYLSKRWLDFTGRSLEQDLGLGWVENLHPDDQARAGEEFLASNSARKPWSHLYRLRRHDGEYRWAIDSAEPRFDESGKYLGYVGTVVDVHERTVAERETQVLRERFDRMVRASDLGVWYCDLPFDVLAWDEQVKRHFWLPPDARVTIDVFYERIHPDDRERTRAAIAKSIESRTPYEVEYRTTDPQDIRHFKWIRAIGWTDYDAQGTPIRFDGITIDVTRHREVEERLRETSERLEQAIDSAQLGTWHVDLATGHARVSDRTLELMGHRPGKVLGLDRVLRDAVHPHDREHVERVMKEGIARRTPYSCEYRIVRPDGEIRWHLSRGQATYASDGTPQAIAGVVVDVTERKLSEERFQTYAEAMPQNAFIADATGAITYLNRRFYEYLGMKADMPASSIKALNIVHPDDVARSVAAWTEAIRTGDPFEIEQRLRRHDGAYRWHLGRSMPVRDGYGRILQWVGTNTDIHEQKETEAKLAQALHSRDEFLSVASHELRTPLTSIQLQAQLLRRKAEKGEPMDPRAERFLDQTERSVRRLSRLVDDMLDLSRIATGKLSLHRERFDLSAMIAEVAERMDPVLEQAGCDLDVHVSPEIVGSWDRFRMEQVVNNLLTNSARYGAGKPVRLRAGLAGPDRAEIRVEDQGRGIAPEDQERIFERFERVEADPGEAEIVGFGLGLYITRNIVELHGGRIHVESVPGQGATFVVQLPLAARA